MSQAGECTKSSYNESDMSSRSDTPQDDLTVRDAVAARTPVKMPASNDQRFADTSNQDNSSNESLNPTEEIAQHGVSFFSGDYSKHRRTLGWKFLMINLFLCTFILAGFSIYWGSYYRRSSYLKNLKFLVVIEDDQTIDGIEPYFGNTLKEILATPIAKERGDWKIYNHSEFQHYADKVGNTVEAEVLRQIHHQHYWASIHIMPNATHNFHKALSQGDTQYNISANTIVSNYETGRDFLNMNSYVVPQIQIIEKMWLQKQSMMAKKLAADITIDSPDKIGILSEPLSFLMIDRAPFNDPVLVAPCQVGFIYMIILTFFVFNFFSDIHSFAAKSGVKKSHFVIYRYLSSILTFAVLSLFFGLATLAFQVDFQVTYGKSGFLVYWAIAFLTMCAVGLANEIVAMLLIVFYPPLLGCWMLFWVVVNISPTFGPIALMDHFYRYGYAIPIHNSFEAVKTVFFDVYKGQLGRNVGILIAWWAVLTMVFPFVLRYFGNTMGQRARAAAEKTRQDAIVAHEKEKAAGEKGGV